MERMKIRLKLVLELFIQLIDSKYEKDTFLESKPIN